jgi:hypothetical protein
MAEPERRLSVGLSLEWFAGAICANAIRRANDLSRFGNRRSGAAGGIRRAEGITFDLLPPDLPAFT